MLKVVLTAIVTFIITAGWQLLATKRNRNNLQFVIAEMYREMEDMAIKLGYNGYVHYVNNTKSQNEADNTLQNINNALLSLTDRG